MISRKREVSPFIQRLVEISASVLGDPNKGERLGLACSDINALAPIPCKRCTCWFGQRVLQQLIEHSERHQSRPTIADIAEARRHWDY